jgi:hypothetical protein
VKEGRGFIATSSQASWQLHGPTNFMLQAASCSSQLHAPASLTKTSESHEARQSLGVLMHASTSIAACGLSVVVSMQTASVCGECDDSKAKPEHKSTKSHTQSSSSTLWLVCAFLLQATVMLGFDDRHQLRLDHLSEGGPCTTCRSAVCGARGVLDDNGCGLCARHCICWPSAGDTGSRRVVAAPRKREVVEAKETTLVAVEV